MTTAKLAPSLLALTLTITFAASAEAQRPTAKPSQTQTRKAVPSTVIRVGGLTKVKRRQLERIRVRIGAEKSRKLERQARAIIGRIRASTRNDRRVSPTRAPRHIRRRITKLVETYVATTGETKFNDVMQGVLYMGVASLEDDLQAMAAAVEAKQKAAGLLRDAIAALQDLLSADAEYPVTLEVPKVTHNRDGTVVVAIEEVTVDNPAEAQALLETLEKQRETNRDMNELERMKLQQLYQNYNQAMSTLAAIMKAQHDTLEAIIANMRA